MERRRRRRIATALAIGASVIIVAITFAFVGHSAQPRVLEAHALRHRIDPYCGGWPPAGFGHPPEVAHTGTVVNARYGYAVEVPAGLTAFTAPDQLGGLGIVLSWTPRTFLRVQALYDVFFDISAGNVHLRDVGAIRLHDRLLGSASTPWSLDGTPGGRYRMQLQCPGHPQIYVRDDVIVVRNREIYRLDLQSVPSRYAADAQLFEQMLRTWRWVPIEP